MSETQMKVKTEESKIELSQVDVSEVEQVFYPNDRKVLNIQENFFIIFCVFVKNT